MSRHLMHSSPANVRNLRRVSIPAAPYDQTLERIDTHVVIDRLTARYLLGHLHADTNPALPEAHQEAYDRLRSALGFTT